MLEHFCERHPDAIWVLDPAQGVFMDCNSMAVELMHARSKEEVLQTRPAEFSPVRSLNGDEAEPLIDAFLAAVRQSGPVDFKWVVRRREGGEIPLRVRSLPVQHAGRELHLIVARDVSVADLVEAAGRARAPELEAAAGDGDRQRRERIQHATYEISEAVHTTEDLPSLYARIHAIVKTLMPADNLYIALADPGGRTFSFPYLMDAHDLSTTPIPMDKGWTGYVLRSGKPLLAGSHKAITPDGLTVVAEDGERVEAMVCGVQLASIWLGAPLTIRGRNIGVVVVQDYEDPRAYREEEKRILTFVGGQIAQAIERKRAEQALRESEEKFRALFEASSQGVMLHDESQYLAVNPAAVRILGYQSQEELIGRHPRDTAPPRQASGESTERLLQQHIQECLTQGSARFEWLAQRAAGEVIPLEVVLTRIEWRGRPIIQAGINDISERKRAEEELLRSLAREKELGQLKSNFVAMVSHEFRTPLGIIQSSTEILADYLDKLDPSDRHAQLESIVKNTRRMANLMEEVLVLGRLDVGRMEFKPAPLELRLFCQRIVDEIAAVTDRRCPVKFRCDGDAGEARADETLMRHIFTNLLSNAVKFSEAAKSVEFAVQRQAGDAVFIVRDGGVGIPAADLPWLFNAFHRGRNVSHVPGAGLGLTIVKLCVELHRGHIGIIKHTLVVADKRARLHGRREPG